MQRTSGTFWSYYKDISTDPITDSGSFKYKSSITGKIIEYYVRPRITNVQGDQISNPDYNVNINFTKKLKLFCH